jgi:hypothetical protein
MFRPRSAISTAQQSLAAESQDSFPSDVDTADDPASHVGRELFAHRASRSASLSSELASIVRDDPDAAVSVLRTWIGNAS